MTEGKFATNTTVIVHCYKGNYLNGEWKVESSGVESSQLVVKPFVDVKDQNLHDRIIVC